MSEPSAQMRTHLFGKTEVRWVYENKFNLNPVVNTVGFFLLSLSGNINVGGGESAIIVLQYVS